MLKVSLAIPCVISNGRSASRDLEFSPESSGPAPYTVFSGADCSARCADITISRAQDHLRPHSGAYGSARLWRESLPLLPHDRNAESKTIGRTANTRLLPVTLCVGGCVFQKCGRHFPAKYNYWVKNVLQGVFSHFFTLKGRMKYRFAVISVLRKSSPESMCYFLE